MKRSADELIKSASTKDIDVVVLSGKGAEKTMDDFVTTSKRKQITQRDLLTVLKNDSRFKHKFIVY